MLNQADIALVFLGILVGVFVSAGFQILFGPHSPKKKKIASGSRQAEEGLPEEEDEWEDDENWEDEDENDADDQDEPEDDPLDRPINPQFAILKNLN